MEDKEISILDVVSHKMILLDQDEGQNISSPLGVIPERIGISGEVTNFDRVCHSCITMDVRRLLLL